jgi:hypothetical protein
VERPHNRGGQRVDHEFSWLTTLPISSRTPQYSSSIDVGPSIGGKPQYDHKSDPQMQVTAMRMIASIGSTIFGVSRSSKRMSRRP